jgi:hypothetical protein
LRNVNGRQAAFGPDRITDTFFRRNGRFSAIPYTGRFAGW